jgi:regulation of enolase protein 1 (concanavalin A-like superfamily)
MMACMLIKTAPPYILLLACLCSQLFAQQVSFQDDFKGKLGEGWAWIREHREAWRLTDRGLQVRVEPGNMWGPQNDARNLLVRPAPQPGESTIEISVAVENKPTHQYEQVDLVWYYDDSHMVKIGQELVDGKLSIVMGREEKDQCRTIAIIPLTSTSVRLRLVAKRDKLVGQFRTSDAADWQRAGECTMPVPAHGTAKICLQFYQGPQDVEHWALVSDFRILTRD